MILEDLDRYIISYEVGKNSLSNYNKRLNKIILNEVDSMNEFVISHEVGHYLFDLLNRQKYEDKFSVIKENAQDLFSKSYVTEDVIHSNLKKLREFCEQSNVKYKNQFTAELVNVLNSSDNDKLYEMLKMALIYYNKLLSYDDKALEQIEMKALDLLNMLKGNENDAVNQILNFLIENYVDNQASSLTMLELSSSSLRGLNMFSDLCSALFDGKYYNFDLVYLHDEEYYLNPSNSLDEQFANYFSIKINNCVELLDNMNKIFGEDYINFMDEIYLEALQKMMKNEKNTLDEEVVPKM